MSPHKNDMSQWETIACTRGHGLHRTRHAFITLAEHRYPDLPQVPVRLTRSWAMDVWDPKAYPVDGKGYCPAHDAVSAAILSHRVWEPRETILAGQVLSTAGRDDMMLDLGAQLGWYSLLAASWGVDALAFEADLANVGVLEASALANGWDRTIDVRNIRIGPDTPPFPLPIRRIRFVKMDLEGSETHAWQMIRPAAEAGAVDHMMIEISPVFADYYPALVEQIIDVGFRAYMLPPKQRPPIDLEHPDVAMLPYRIDTLPRIDLARLVASWHQEDIWFQREGAEW